MEIYYNEYLISDDKERLDLDKVKGYLARSYWANQRSEEKIEKSIEESVCFGIYKDKKQVGFARVVTDDATMYWLCDVFIDENYRGLGLGKYLVETITESERFRKLTGLLGTRDAHELYEQFHFVRDRDRLMRRAPR
ncbi:GNAT family N-acetyltransferase [Paenibacillus lentus]|uniref:N-acetyltransferase n=1 Tax=Paenibacillus lentus TaxID=1338368 RepID=A0A3S8RQ70_9BACL|nr:GNAT family N-acetyltransferase [Paenibacillus lentus]AZK45081.1 N-acetyltransferase [Paenibacillus lentus]